MQPYLFPYLGYYQLIHSSQKFVIYDDVNFIKQGWINRNYILLNNNKHLFTLNVSNASSNININKVLISKNDNRLKLLKMFSTSYRKAPYYHDVMPLIEQILLFKSLNLSEVIINSIYILSSYLKLNTELIISSQLQKDDNQKGQEKVITICNNLNTTKYINPIGGAHLYNSLDFKNRNIDLVFLKPTPIRYKQYNNEFIPNLSIIDVLMFNSIHQVQNLLNRYEVMKDI